ncbi:hypothetical protein [Solirubrobacter soli]|uniref:hypothetical protein n=1 Tax=Solirubrobacter soli TaxID=363832 RepID=UPI00040B0BCA|nr:hypothetical protein [Solirubrobacter soli]
MISTRLFLILGAVFGGTVAIGVLVAWVLLSHESAARDASTQFATALVNKNPNAGPKGADDYLDGILANFGPIKSARVIDTRNTTHGHGNDATTWFVGDVLLDTAKGPMVVELAFNGGMLVNGYDKVTGIEELAPADVPGDALSDAEFAALAKAFDARGGSPADSTLLDGVWLDTTTPDPAPVIAQTDSPQLGAAKRQLACVQKAEGDVDKLARCASGP